MLNRPGHDFSFSGLKTAVMLEVRKAEAEGNLAAGCFILTDRGFSVI